MFISTIGLLFFFSFLNYSCQSKYFNTKFENHRPRLLVLKLCSLMLLYIPWQVNGPRIGWEEEECENQTLFQLSSSMTIIYLTGLTSIRPKHSMTTKILKSNSRPQNNWHPPKNIRTFAKIKSQYLENCWKSLKFTKLRKQENSSVSVAGILSNLQMEKPRLKIQCPEGDSRCKALS
jgi:hypothetical protein